MTTTLLEREMYTEAGAARLLRVPSATLHYWLEGGTRLGKTYRPVIRQEPTGQRSVTWAEFVEAGLLREYRRQHQVPMRELRALIDGLREQMGVPYPLAHVTPYVSGRELLYREQERVGLEVEFALVAAVRNQYVLTPSAESFYTRVTWGDDIAVRWRPAGDPDSPVVVDPLVRWGRPSIRGISTEILAEQAAAGEDEGDLAATYGLSLADVRWALSYEMSIPAAA